MSDVADPGPEAVDKILDGLENFIDPPAEVARKARRLRAHIAALRSASTPTQIETVAAAMQKARDEIGATEQQRIAFGYAEAAMREALSAYNTNDRLREALEEAVAYIRWLADGDSDTIVHAGTLRAKADKLDAALSHKD